MKIKVQDCGCIALPKEIAKQLGVAAGSVFEATSDGEDRFIFIRITPRVISEDVAAKVACPIS